MSPELVSVQTADGVTLHGTFQRPEAGLGPRLGLDCVILHHGAGGNFYNFSRAFEIIESGLLAQGCAVLRVNSRGHDLLFNSPIGPLGAAFETVDNCRLDFKAWIDFAEASGFRSIVPWGHSLGAVKTIYYMAMAPDARVPCAVAVSPPRFSYSSFLAKEGAAAFERDYDHAVQLVSGGEPDGLFAIGEPIRSIMSARTYIDKYGPEERYDILKFLPQVAVPTLVTVGNESTEGPGHPHWFPFHGLAEKIAAIATDTPRLTFVHIPEADHSYGAKAEDLWSAARVWFERTAVRAGSV